MPLHVSTRLILLLALAIPVKVDAATQMLAGVNLSGLEVNAGTLPGRPNYDYAAPSPSELDYYNSRGITVVRLPILWERMQPGLLASPSNPSLDQSYLGLVKSIVAAAGARKMYVLVDLHDYGAYNGNKLGNSALSATAFATFWRSLAQSLAGSPGLLGYDLMNEPNGLPSALVWPAAAQAAVNAIRSVDQRSYIAVEGDNWASAGSWTSSNQNLKISDSSYRLIYEAHVYGDRDNSGTHFSWSTESAAGVTTQTIANRVSVFSGWCTQQHVGCFIGEVGVGNDSPQWNVELANGLAAMSSGGMLLFTYWAGGPWWGSYPMSIEPTVLGDAPQMTVVRQYAN